jgi:hypothetical protein
MLDANNNPFIPTIPVAFTTFAVGQDLYDKNAPLSLAPWSPR